LLRETVTNLKKRWRYTFWWVNPISIPLYGIISDRYRFIYFPINRVAHSSTMDLLADVMDLEKPANNPVFGVDFPFITSLKKGQYPDYFKFCIVRNPFDRVVSCYRDKIKQDRSEDNEWIDQGVAHSLLRYNDRPHLPNFQIGMSFEDFVFAISRIPDPFADEHFRSQSAFVPKKGRKHLLDDVARYENLDNEIKLISSKLGWPNKELRQVLPSSKHGKEYNEYYATYTQELVLKRFRQDFEMFGYSTEL